MSVHGTNEVPRMSHLGNRRPPFGVRVRQLLDGKGQLARLTL